MFSMIPYRYNRVTRRQPDTRDLFTPFFDDFFRPFFGELRTVGGLKVDVEDKGDHYLLEADLPGVTKENLRVEVEDGAMTIAATLNEEKEDKNRNYVCRERRCGTVSRIFSLEGIREDGIAAEFKDGVLRLTLPKQAEAPQDNARRIEIA